jgi:hypothetical protein
MKLAAQINLFFSPIRLHLQPQSEADCASEPTQASGRQALPSFREIIEAEGLLFHPSAL